MSGTTDIRDWAKAEDSTVPKLAWDIYVDDDRQLWLHDQNTAVWYLIERNLYSPGYHTGFGTTMVPDGVKLLVKVIAEEALGDFLPEDAE